MFENNDIIIHIKGAIAKLAKIDGYTNHCIIDDLVIFVKKEVRFRYEMLLSFNN